MICRERRPAWSLGREIEKRNGGTQPLTSRGLHAGDRRFHESSGPLVQWPAGQVWDRTFPEECVAILLSIDSVCGADGDTPAGVQPTG